ncbi:hypothetical protein Isop_0141 [Isosphaera pallida ATCC 43644]|jgi:hypothetical protein|uniref:Uncharacterized protein n=1 Tax=Isosphaera pallida (strain ATCC 43644 / DSM 9630 / IS1B) TaxID=575540 RepID=E8R643_ISOPI|nr:hypothetical protein [Isosphaera pallida]ADV60738.1 hypothetical protein Isop_0141 [Isosphaera pallida ATCC 43644]
MSRSFQEIKPPPEIKGNRGLIRTILALLLIFSPVLLDCAWVVASWWQPFLGVGPVKGDFNTPFLDALGAITGFSSEQAAFVWGDFRDQVFMTPTVGITVFLAISGVMMLFMSAARNR